MKLPRFLREAFRGYEVTDLKEWLTTKGFIEINIEAKKDKDFNCHRCLGPLSYERGKYPVRLEALPMMGIKVFVIFMRRKGHCTHCKKARAEAVEFVAPESPHLTADYAYWLGRLCEIAAVSRAAELVKMQAITLWRHDHARMRRYLQHYKIPQVTHLSVDEVYARSKSKFEGESRAEKFFTIISDLKTRKVVWVAFSCRREALDEFFSLIGSEACKNIEAIAMDQHADYAASAREHCPQALIVLDRFHLTQDFEEALNETRKDLFEEFHKQDPIIAQHARGQNRFVFLEKASRRSPQNQSLIDEVARRNHRFLKLELIKERLLDLFNQPSAEAARQVFDEVGDWVWQMNFKPLMKWHRWIEERWNTVANYFKLRISTGLSEALNNVIKTIKKRAYGYRNMHYFRLKIMQVCGYLNSKFISLENSNTCTNL